MLTQKLKRIRALIDARNVSAAVIQCMDSTIPNIHYMTGYKDVWPNTLIITEDEAILFASEKAKAKRQTSGLEVIGTSDTKLSDILRELGLEKSRIGVDGTVQYNFYNRLLEKLPKIKPVDISQDLEELRAVKDVGEIEKIREACLSSDRLFADLLEWGVAKRTEKQVASEIAHLMVDRGMPPAFDTIVSGDANTSNVHHVPEASRFKDLMMVDFGMKKDLYSSDMTRTFLMKKDPKIMNAKGAVLELHHALGDFIEPGLKASDVHEFAVKLMEDRGFKTSNFGNFHALGHGVGLEVHESPRIGPRSDVVLKEDMVFTLEPGIYFPGKFGIRIEDTVHLTKGGLRRLSKFPKEKDLF